MATNKVSCNRISEILSQLNAIRTQGFDKEVAVCAIRKSDSGDNDSLITAMEAWSDDFEEKKLNEPQTT